MSITVPPNVAPTSPPRTTAAEAVRRAVGKLTDGAVHLRVLLIGPVHDVRQAFDRRGGGLGHLAAVRNCQRGSRDESIGEAP